MEGKISGSFPGGPSRKTPPEQRQRKPRLDRVEEIETRRAARSVERRRKARRRRVIYGFVASAVVAGGVGVLLGIRSQVTEEDIRAEQEEAAAPRELDLSQEVNRTLLELWRMEDIEAARNRGRTR